MKSERIQSWLEYWEAAKVCEFGATKEQRDLEVARQYVPEMRRGPFAKVSDRAMWEALVDLRWWRAHEAECRTAAEALLRERGVA